MKQKFIFVAFATFALAGYASNGSGQTPGFPERTPKEVVERLWNMAARGELLTTSGWDEATKIFTKPGSQPEKGAIRVYSDYFGVNFSSVDGTSAVVDMEYADAGLIDTNLRYTPPKQSQATKTSFRYHLVSVQGYGVMYGADGKTIVQKKEIPGASAWQIEGPPPDPWITVNAAIRYVLEMRNKTSDPAVKVNADATLSKLLEMH
jgi:hypothetical protein